MIITKVLIIPKPGSTCSIDRRQKTDHHRSMLIATVCQAIASLDVIVKFTSSANTRILLNRPETGMQTISDVITTNAWLQ